MMSGTHDPVFLSSDRWLDFPNNQGLDFRPFSMPQRDHSSIRTQHQFILSWQSRRRQAFDLIGLLVGEGFIGCSGCLRIAYRKWYKETLTIQTRGKGLYPFTQAVEDRLRQWGVTEGMCYLFIPHTSASLVISENYDPTAKIDLEAFMECLAPEDEPWYRHTLEGSDDSPSHIRAMLTQTSLTVPIDAGKLSLGTWQGLYVFEHRSYGHQRRVLLRCFDIL